MRSNNTSLYSSFNDAPGGRGSPKASIYGTPVMPNYPSSPSANSMSNDAVIAEKSQRYIRYLKEQNVQLKQQLDQERQNMSRVVSAAPQSSSFSPNAMGTGQIHQLVQQYNQLKSEYERFRAECEKQTKERLNQIDSLLTEKQRFIAEKERMAAENKQLAEAAVQGSPAEREKQLRLENSKLKAEISKVKAKVDEVVAEKEELIAENEKLQQQIEEMNEEVERLKRQKGSANVTPTSSKKGSSQKRSKTSPKYDTENLIELNTEIKLLNQQLRDKTRTLDEVRAKYNDLKKDNDRLFSDYSELKKRHDKLFDENNILSATIIRQKNDLDARKKEITTLQIRQAKIKKLLKVVTSIRNQNNVLAQRNRELESKLMESKAAASTPTSPRQVFSLTTTPTKELSPDRSTDKIINRLSERIDNLIQQVTIDSATKTQQIDDLGKKISNLNQNHRNLSETVGQLQSQLVDTSLKEIDPGDISSLSDE